MGGYLSEGSPRRGVYQRVYLDGGTFRDIHLICKKKKLKL